MPAITVKNIPDTVYEQLKLTAQTHHRSINSEILVCIEKEVMPIKIPAEQRIARARKLRSAIQLDEIDPGEIEQAIQEGRP